MSLPTTEKKKIIVIVRDLYVVVAFPFRIFFYPHTCQTTVVWELYTCGTASVLPLYRDIDNNIIMCLVLLYFDTMPRIYVVRSQAVGVLYYLQFFAVESEIPIDVFPTNSFVRRHFPWQHHLSVNSIFAGKLRSIYICHFIVLLTRNTTIRIVWY